MNYLTTVYTSFKIGGDAIGIIYKEINIWIFVIIEHIVFILI